MNLKIFWNSFAGGAGSIITTAFLWFLIYQSKKYLNEKSNFDIFSRNILEVKEEFCNIASELKVRYDFSYQSFLPDCTLLDKEQKEINNYFFNILNASKDNKEKEISDMKARLTYNKIFQEISGKITTDFSSKDFEEITTKMSNTVQPCHLIITPFQFAIPTLEELKNDKLNFLYEKH